ncbi:MAG: hypothetical protein EOO22_13315 [Comamonadaceae bacterium]|nr:MAG: hypothetical protein EOO22_13315 [Comamonadaceae bacterium]
MATTPEHSERPMAPATQPAPSDAPAGSASEVQGEDAQDDGTGANHGSPAANVMKQFQKTEAESGGSR